MNHGHFPGDEDPNQHGYRIEGEINGQDITAVNYSTNYDPFGPVHIINLRVVVVINNVPRPGNHGCAEDQHQKSKISDHLPPGGSIMDQENGRHQLSQTNNDQVRNPGEPD